jgi:hypothetical protein
MTRHRQKLGERIVFREFANVCPLPLLPATARTGDDPPDVLCDLQSGETLAFELVSIEDQINDRSVLEKPVAITKTFNDEQKLRIALSEAYDEAVSTGRVDRPERFACHSIRVDFLEAASFAKRRKDVRRVIDLLNQHGPGRHIINDKSIRSISCEVCYVASRDRPTFFVGSSYWHVGNSTVAGIQAKVNEIGKHKFACKTHLLAYSLTASAAESEFWRSKLVNLIQLKGPFKRIWVFAYCEKSILFDSGA